MIIEYLRERVRDEKARGDRLAARLKETTDLLWARTARVAELEEALRTCREEAERIHGLERKPRTERIVELANRLLFEGPYAGARQYQRKRRPKVDP